MTYVFDETNLELKSLVDDLANLDDPNSIINDGTHVLIINGHQVTLRGFTSNILNVIESLQSTPISPTHSIIRSVDDTNTNVITKAHDTIHAMSSSIKDIEKLVKDTEFEVSTTGNGAGLKKVFANRLTLAISSLAKTLGTKVYLRKNMAYNMTEISETDDGITVIVGGLPETCMSKLTIYHESTAYNYNCTIPLPEHITLYSNGIAIAQLISPKLIRLTIFQCCCSGELPSNPSTEVSFLSFIFTEIGKKLQQISSGEVKIEDITAENTKRIYKALSSSIDILIKNNEEKSIAIKEAIQDTEKMLTMLFNQKKSIEMMLSSNIGKSQDASHTILESIKAMNGITGIRSIILNGDVEYLAISTNKIYFVDSRTNLRHLAGKFVILISLPTSSQNDIIEVTVRNTLFTIRGMAQYCDHPHIMSGKPCYGNISTTMSKLRTSRDFIGIVAVMLRFLSSVNTDDTAGMWAHRWPVVDNEGNFLPQYDYLKQCDMEDCFNCTSTPRTCALSSIFTDEQIECLESTQNSEEEEDENA